MVLFGCYNILTCETFEYYLLYYSTISESKAKKARISAKEKFTRTNNRLIHALEEEAPEKTVCNRFKELQEAWKEVKEKHEEYVDELTEGESDDSWIAQLSQMLDETEIKTDKYLEKIRKNEQEVIEQKTQEERKTEEK